MLKSTLYYKVHNKKDNVKGVKIYVLQQIVMDFVVPFGGLEVADDFYVAREGATDLFFDLRSLLVGGCERYIVVEEEVKLDEKLVSRVAVPKVMEADAPA